MNDEWDSHSPGTSVASDAAQSFLSSMTLGNDKIEEIGSNKESDNSFPNLSHHRPYILFSVLSTCLFVGKHFRVKHLLTCH